MIRNYPLLNLKVALLLTLLCSPTLLSAQILPEFLAVYGVEKFGIKAAEAKYQLSYTDSGYKFTQNTKLYGFAKMLGNDTISVVSLVDETGDNLLLKKHTYIQTGREKNRNEDFSIHWNTYKNTLKGEVTGIVRSKPINLKTDTEVWDVLSFQIPMMIEVNPNIKEYPYKAILKGEIDTYNFIISGKKTIMFSDKEYLVLNMVRTDPKKNRQVHIWVAPELHNLPVIITNYRDGKEHSHMQLESIQFHGGKTLIDQIEDVDDDF